MYKAPKSTIESRAHFFLESAQGILLKQIQPTTPTNGHNVSHYNMSNTQQIS